MTDPRKWKWDHKWMIKREPEPEPDPLPENWQAVAMILCAELHERIMQFHLWYYGLHYAKFLDDYTLYKFTLEQMEAWANDRPE
jgi:hypothetical protein